MGTSGTLDSGGWHQAREISGLRLEVSGKWLEGISHSGNGINGTLIIFAVWCLYIGVNTLI